MQRRRKDDLLKLTHAYTSKAQGENLQLARAIGKAKECLSKVVSEAFVKLNIGEGQACHRRHVQENPREVTHVHVTGVEVQLLQSQESCRRPVGDLTPSRNTDCGREFEVERLQNRHVGEGLADLFAKGGATMGIC